MRWREAEGPNLSIGFSFNTLSMKLDSTGTNGHQVPRMDRVGLGFDCYISLCNK